MVRLLSVLVVSLVFCARPSAAEFSSYAVLQDDASLVIQNRVVRLFGIYIPDPGQFCDTRLRPAFCGKRAATALNFKIRGFVTWPRNGYLRRRQYRRGLLDEALTFPKEPTWALT
jgi:endonuclease YncB( thermonuclease family)